MYIYLYFLIYIYIYIINIRVYIVVSLCVACPVLCLAPDAWHPFGRVSPQPLDLGGSAGTHALASI